MMGSPLYRCYCCAGLVCSEPECVFSCVTCFVMFARLYSGLSSLVFCSLINKICCCSTHVTWQGTDYKLPDDDMLLSKLVGV
jgi:hypothetical protein